MSKSPIKGSQKLVVGSLVLHLLLILTILKKQTCAHKRQVHDHVDLIKGQPVFYLIPKAFKQRRRILYK